MRSAAVDAILMDQKHNRVLLLHVEMKIIILSVIEIYHV